MISRTGIILKVNNIWKTSMNGTYETEALH